MGRLKKTAAQQAQAQYGPQRRATRTQVRHVRRDTRGQVASLHSEDAALQHSLDVAARKFRHAGLSPRDLKIALAELANRGVDVAAGTKLQVSAAHQDQRNQMVDLRSTLAGINADQGAATASNLAALQAAAAAAPGGAQDIRDRRLDLKFDVKKDLIEHRLGLDSSSGGGLTPTQQRDAAESKHNAAFWAHQLFRASKSGDPTKWNSEWGKMDDPTTWSDSVWQGLAGSVAGAKGVNSTHDAAWAVKRIREHVAPSPLETLGKLASAAPPGTAAALTPTVLKPLAGILGGVASGLPALLGQPHQR